MSCEYKQEAALYGRGWGWGAINDIYREQKEDLEVQLVMHINSTHSNRSFGGSEYVAIGSSSRITG